MIRINENLISLKTLKQGVYFDQVDKVLKNHVGHNLVEALVKPSTKYIISARKGAFYGVRIPQFDVEGNFLNVYYRESSNNIIITTAETASKIYISGSYQFIGSHPRDWKLEEGTEATLWTPAHADMTPEQIALMKYGEYKEIKSF